MITGCLQQKNGYYYAVLYLKVDGKRRNKWIPTKLPIHGTSSRKAQKAFNEIRLQYERDEEERLRIEEEERELLKNNHPDALLPFTAYIDKWLLASKPTLATTTYQSYCRMVNGRIHSYFDPKELRLMDVRVTHIDNFYQSIFDSGCTANTVIHYHAILSKVFKTATKKKVLRENPMDGVDRPKKNAYQATFYTVDEMLSLMEAFSEDPLDLPVQIAAYYGLRRSEVLGLKWKAIDFTNKTISIRHKVIEAEINGKFVPVGEDVLKTKSSFRTLPLIPEIESLLLKEKETQEMYRRLFKRSYCKDYLDYICVDQTGKLLRPNYVTEHFSWIINKYGLKKIRFHDLRHTCASLLLSKGISMKQIQIWLGHSTFSTTADIYAHLDYSAHKESASVMTGIFIRSNGEDSTT